MPTYEYACTSCAHEWEFEQSIKDDPLKECPKCHADTARRQISRGTGFILKGSGWYSDLYSSPAAKPADPAKPPPDGGGDGAKKSTTTEAAPAKSDAATSTGTPKGEGGSGAATSKSESSIAAA